jgi:predicted ester cyclase
LSGSNKEIVRRFLEQSLKENRTIDEICASGFMAHIGAMPAMTLEAFKDYQDNFYRSFTEGSIKIEEIIQEGSLVAFRGVVHTVFAAEFMGMPASGREIEVPVIGMARLKEGKIYEWWNSPDRLSLMQQLGFALRQV